MTLCVNRVRSDAEHRARPVCRRASANRKPGGTGSSARFLRCSSSNMLWHVLRPRSPKLRRNCSVRMVQS